MNDMAQLYPSLFSFHLLGASPGHLAKRHGAATAQTSRQQESLLPAAGTGHCLHNAGNALFLRQKQLLDLIADSGLLGPQQQTLNTILAYAARRVKGQRTL